MDLACFECSLDQSLPCISHSLDFVGKATDESHRPISHWWKFRNGDSLGLVDALPVLYPCSEEAVTLLLHAVVDDTRHLFLPDLQAVYADVVLANNKGIN